MTVTGIAPGNAPDMAPDMAPVDGSLAGILPGPELATALADVDLSGVDQFEVVEVLKAARRMASWAAAVEVSAIAELYRRREAQASTMPHVQEPEEVVADEVAAALTLTGMTAGNLVDVALTLDDCLPATLAALAAGRIDVAKARVFCTGIRLTSAAVVAAVEERVLPKAAERTTAWLRAAIATMVKQADPQAHARRRAEARARQRVELWDNPEETGDLAGRDLPIEYASRAFNRINAIAAALKADGDQRPIDFLRGEVFTALLLGQDPYLGRESADLPPDPPHDNHDNHDDSEDASHDDSGHDGQDDSGHDDSHGSQNDGQDGQDDSHGDGRDDSGDAAATERGVAGWQPSTASRDREPERAEREQAHAIRVDAAQVAELLRAELAALSAGRNSSRALRILQATRSISDALAADKARWCHTSLRADEPTAHGHQPTVHGHQGYRPPARMRRLVDARDETCRFPGCRRAAARCDQDHTIPYHLGGATCACNLSVLCRRHHVLKQDPRWSLLQPWPGVLVWIAPTGHWYLTGPEP